MTLISTSDDRPKKATLYYAVDPMCSWCWGFKPTWQVVYNAYASQTTLAVRYVMGGLAPDSDQPMPAEMQQHLQHIWRQIQRTIPGTEFNFDFWSNNIPRRSTYPACRAVLAARSQSVQLEQAMLLAIQEAYYLQAKNPSDYSTLTELAKQIGCDTDQFTQELTSRTIDQQLKSEIHFARELGAMGFPSLILETATGSRHPMNVAYGNPQHILEQIELLNVG
ncbi:MAG: DsbA family protein [Granulosicoccus sp.]|nr:DsbA family protein [Granulosicoccus sp.]